jgi:hypothetical protein
MSSETVTGLVILGGVFAVRKVCSVKIVSANGEQEYTRNVRQGRE